MATNAQVLIEAAYARSTANDPGKLATDTELLGVADRVYQVLFALAAAVNPDAYITRTECALSSSVGPLPTDVIDLRRAQSSGGQRVNIIPIEEIDRSWHLPPAVFREGSNLVSRGNVGDPGPSDVLTIWVLAAPVNLVALTTPLDVRFPVRNHEIIINYLARYLAIKDVSRSPSEFTALSSEAQGLMAVFLQLSGLTTTALQSPHAGKLIERVESLLAAPRA